jgi:hypothetical protein
MSLGRSAVEVAGRIYARAAPKATSVDQAITAVSQVTAQLDRVMSNLIGQMGFRAMFSRCVRKIQPSYECLRDIHLDDRSPPLEPLVDCLRAAAPPLILEIGTRILAAFFDLSNGLIGYEVTARMFSDAWPEAFSHARNGAEKS